LRRKIGKGDIPVRLFWKMTGNGIRAAYLLPNKKEAAPLEQPPDLSRRVIPVYSKI
jgi:hypothetical protein